MCAILLVVGRSFALWPTPLGGGPLKRTFLSMGSVLGVSEMGSGKGGSPWVGREEDGVEPMWYLSLVYKQHQVRGCLGHQGYEGGLGCGCLL